MEVSALSKILLSPRNPQISLIQMILLILQHSSLSPCPLTTESSSPVLQETR